MIKIKTHRSGMTLIEVMLVVCLVGIIVSSFFLFFDKNTNFYKRTQVRQQILVDSRTCMDTIIIYLRNAKAKTVVINTPTAGTPLVPNSQIDFDLQSPVPSGATHCLIALNNGTVSEIETVGGIARPAKLLASHVTSLMFTGSSQDPSIVKVTLQMTAPWDASGDPSHASTLILPNQVVHLPEMP